MYVGMELMKIFSKKWDSMHIVGVWTIDNIYKFCFRLILILLACSNAQGRGQRLNAKNSQTCQMFTPTSTYTILIIINLFLK